MSKLREYVEKINEMTNNNQAAEVYEKYYADDIVSVDLDGTVTEGKQAHIDGMAAWGENIIEMHPSSVVGYVVSGDENDGTVVAIWHHKFSHKEWGEMDYDQASVTKWKDGKVVHEQFLAEMPSE